VQPEQDERLQRARWALEGVSVGDAYGNHHGNNQRKRLAEIWEFSDDTDMALSIVSNLRLYGEIRQNELAQSFAARWEGWRGYGQGVTRLLKSIRRGTPWNEAATSMFDGKGSYGNGAAMRVAPLGAYYADDLARVVDQAHQSAVVTHAHPEGTAGAIAVAVAAALAYQLRNRKLIPSRRDFLDLVLLHVPQTEVRQKIEVARDLAPDTTVQDAAAVLGNGRPVLAQLTVPFTLWMAGGYLVDYKAAIERTASARGDVDTNCAIVGGIVAMFTGIEGIPTDWLRRREPLPSWPFENELSTNDASH
jgi:ADP-ribosylglycohydrolase